MKNVGRIEKKKNSTICDWLGGRKVFLFVRKEKWDGENVIGINLLSCPCYIKHYNFFIIFPTNILNIFISISLYFFITKIISHKKPIRKLKKKMMIIYIYILTTRMKKKKKNTHTHTHTTQHVHYVSSSTYWFKTSTYN